MPVPEASALNQLGKYQILRPLGAGAMGEVFLAYHPVLEREVAIKVILAAAARGAEAEARFRREAQAAGRLNHPNLVTIHDFDKDQGVLFLVMEYVDGEDLADLIRAGSLAPRQVLEILAQVCEGLAHAHQAGIVHRDIKPSNVRVVRTGPRLQAKVMDFGLARQGDHGLTATGVVVGTLSYLAPETIREGTATPLSDLFAVGVMLYEALGGRRPFDGENATTLFKIVTEDPAPIEVAPAWGVSPHLRTVLDRALAKDPAGRFADGHAFAQALRQCADPSWTGLAPVEAPAAPERSAPFALRRTGLWVAAGLLGLAGVLVPAWRIARRQAKTTAPPPALTSSEAAPGPRPNPGPAPAPSSPNRTAALAAPSTPGPATAVAAPAALPVPAFTRPGVAEARPEAVPHGERPAPRESPEELLAKAVDLLDEDPGQAALILKDLAAAHPSDPAVQGNYLAALYRAQNPAGFERAFAAARGAGLNVSALLKVPSFRNAIQEETRRHRTRSLYPVLPPEVMARVLEGLPK